MFPTDSSYPVLTQGHGTTVAVDAASGRLRPPAPAGSRARARRLSPARPDRREDLLEGDRARRQAGADPETTARGVHRPGRDGPASAAPRMQCLIGSYELTGDRSSSGLWRERRLACRTPPTPSRGLRKALKRSGPVEASPAIVSRSLTGGAAGWRISSAGGPRPLRRRSWSRADTLDFEEAGIDVRCSTRPAGRRRGRPRAVLTAEENEEWARLHHPHGDWTWLAARICLKTASATALDRRSEGLRRREGSRGRPRLARLTALAPDVDTNCSLPQDPFVCTATRSAPRCSARA